MTVRIFFSHHERDAEHCDELSKHLRPAERSGRVQIWHHRRVAPGTDVVRTVEEKLEEADIIVLLLSADLLDSDYCWGVEVSAAMQRHRMNRARLIPLILRHCNWKDCFSNIRSVPADESPIVLDAGRINDAGFAAAARELLDVASEFEQRKPSPTEHSSVTSVRSIVDNVSKLDARDSPTNAAIGLLRINALLRYPAQQPGDESGDVDDNAETRVIPRNDLPRLAGACMNAFLQDVREEEIDRVLDVLHPTDAVDSGAASEQDLKSDDVLVDLSDLEVASSRSLAMTPNDDPGVSSPRTRGSSPWKLSTIGLGLATCALLVYVLVLKFTPPPQAAGSTVSATAVTAIPTAVPTIRPEAPVVATATAEPLPTAAPSTKASSTTQSGTLPTATLTASASHQLPDAGRSDPSGSTTSSTGADLFADPANGTGAEPSSTTSSDGKGNTTSDVDETPPPTESDDPY